MSQSMFYCLMWREWHSLFGVQGCIWQMFALQKHGLQCSQTGLGESLCGVHDTQLSIFELEGLSQAKGVAEGKAF